MPFQLNHTLLAKTFRPQKRTEGNQVFFRVALKGELPIRSTGALTKHARASFALKVEIDDVDEPIDPSDPDRPRPGSTPLHGGVSSTTESIPLTLRIIAPNGREFTASEITLADLNRFRDARGAPIGPWKYTLSGESQPILLLDGITMSNPKGQVSIKLVETITSQSAPPLVRKTPLMPGPQSFRFDLFRVGTFVAEVSTPSFGTLWSGNIRLRDPDGVVVAETTQKRLEFEADLPTLDKSRDADGKIRLWTLEAASSVALTVRPRIEATVIARGRLGTQALRDRIDALLGPRGSFIELFGENKDGKARARLRVNDVVSAETIDMRHLLDKRLKSQPQDPGVDPKDFNANVDYTLYSRSEKLAKGIKLNVGSLRVKTIDVAIGAGNQLGPIPTVRLTIAVSGKVKATFKGLDLATGKVRGGTVSVEVGMKLERDGTPKVVVATPKSPFDLDIGTAGKAALLLVLGIGGLITGVSISEYLEREINEAMSKGVEALFDDPTIAPRILMMLFGGHMTYRPFRVEGNDLVFDYVAPLEPDPRPTPGYQSGIEAGDTWAADNLASKIDHVVVVMMENRSHDHVMGYRARAPISDGSDGLTEELIEAIAATPLDPGDVRFDVRNLRDAAFDDNLVGLKTRFPRPVGHKFTDVTQQLSRQSDGPNGPINSPKGFVDNFKEKIGQNSTVVENDVLGFYDEQELPFFAYLAENYAYCDTFFSSHPGPTLPNRMYSLTGDVQFDRYGVPIIENNDSDNFVLSRAPTVYDFLLRKGLDFRVYESFPSVTMLRMFARYATDDTNIVPLDRLAADVARGDLPAFTAIEPQMHAHPQDDDHPVADMHRGQLFIKRVYDALTSNQALWEKTLLIVTYDEHGGFYDHVVPPTAEVFRGFGPVLSPRLTATTAATPMTSGMRATLSAVAAARGLGAFGRLGDLTTVPEAVIVAGELSTTAKSVTVPYGVRVPTFVISPWTTPGLGPRLVLDHCSILKTVLARFLGADKPFLSDRVNAANSFEAYLSEAAPRLNVPPFAGSLPDLPIDARLSAGPSATTRIVTKPLKRKAMRQGSVDYHDLTGHWARQLGR